MTWPALQISNLQKPHRLIVHLVRACSQLRDAMAEKKSAAPSHPPYSALVKEAILSLKVGPSSDQLLVAASRRLERVLKLFNDDLDDRGTLLAAFQRCLAFRCLSSSLQERSGSSLQAITKHVGEKHPNLPGPWKKVLSNHVRKLKLSGKLVQVTPSAATSSSRPLVGAKNLFIGIEMDCRAGS